MPVWGLSVQNEPMAIQRWESCIFTAEEERFYKRLYWSDSGKIGLEKRKIISLGS